MNAGVGGYGAWNHNDGLTLLNYLIIFVSSKTIINLIRSRGEVVFFNHDITYLTEKLNRQTRIILYFIRNYLLLLLFIIYLLNYLFVFAHLSQMQEHQRGI